MYICNIYCTLCDIFMRILYYIHIMYMRRVLPSGTEICSDDNIKVT